MPGHDQLADVLYILDTNTISEIFRSYYPDRFPSFWERFDDLVSTHRAVSVRSVERELAIVGRGEIAGSTQHLRELNRDFFSDPNEQEQVLVRHMFNDPNLTAANNRWRSKATRDAEDADPFLIAKARAYSGFLIRTVVVTQESGASAAGIPSVCQSFQIPFINLREMMSELGWQF